MAPGSVISGSGALIGLVSASKGLGGGGGGEEQEHRVGMNERLYCIKDNQTNKKLNATL